MYLSIFFNFRNNFLLQMDYCACTIGNLLVVWQSCYV